MYDERGLVEKIRVKWPHLSDCERKDVLLEYAQEEPEEHNRESI